MARALAEQLDLPDTVVEALDGSYEIWNGKGWPRGVQGEAIPIAARIAQLAEFLEVAFRVGGVDGARELARKRRGGQFDPALCRSCWTTPTGSSPDSRLHRRGMP